MQGIIFDWVGTLYQRNSGLFPYSKKVLEELKDRYYFGLISIAKNKVEQRKKEIEDSGIAYMFKSLIIEEEKTPEQYLICMKELGTNPKNTVIVDDRSIRGVKIGNQLGCTTVWIQKGEYAKELPNSDTGKPTHIIHSIEELLDVI